MPRAAISASILFLILPVAAVAAEPCQAPVEAAKSFLTAYVSGDKARVLAMTSDRDLHVYGSDESEVFSGKAALSRMFDLDQKLWSGVARFDGVRNMSAVCEGDLASLIFDDTFILGERRVPVRFAQTWRREDGAWKLVQSSNVVPTVGQSAAELLGETPVN